MLDDKTSACRCGTDLLRRRTGLCRYHCKRAIPWVKALLVLCRDPLATALTVRLPHGHQPPPKCKRPQPFRMRWQVGINVSPFLEGDVKMRGQIAAIMCLAVLGIASSSSLSIAQQKTAKACQEEWRANKAANQANGITEKAYVTQCRGSSASTQPTAAPATPSAPGAAPTATAPAEPRTATAPATRAAPATTSTARPAPTTPATPAGVNQFSTEAEAKARCPADTVVWVTLSSKIYHFSGTRYYGNTKNGAYMCERDTAAAGMRAAKNETHP
jgi:hypothetical protein